GWENDGAAPRDFLAGLAENLTPGAAHRYPLLHYLVIGVWVLPVLLGDAVVALVAHVPVREVVLSVTSMTLIALLTKLLHLAMMSVALLGLARTARDSFGVSAARWGVAFAMLNLSVVYYGRATNVDAAYLMWVSLWVDQLSRLRHGGEPARYRGLALLMAAAVATKDQAFAAFLLPGLLFLVVLPVARRQRDLRRHFAELARAGAVLVVAYALLSGAALNPTGFVRRLALLSGPNSQDWRQYEASWAGCSRT
ncbi:MAG TPA: glycosyltransferase family 39 protein, partial [Polyangiaceae bacterium]|nr:glycosyltransferase family 39 protein [Polyangiaceae bacterium]